MRKIIMYLSLAVLAVSCGDDDSGASGKVPVQITMTSEDDALDNVYQFQYDSRNRLKSYTRSGGQDLAYSFEYGDQQLPQSVTITGDIEASVQFAYDEQDRLISFDSGGVPTTITYPTENSFVIGALSGTLSTSGDLQTLQTLLFSYGSEKGAFANVKGVNPIVMAFLENNMPYFASKKALTALTNSQNPALSTTVTHTFDQNLPVMAQVQGGSTFVMSITYE